MITAANETQVEALLKKQLIGRIGCSAEGIMYVVPISYAYENNCVYAHTYEGLKVELMRKNPAVCFEVDDICDTSNWKSVIAWGTFEELTEPEERIKALYLLNSRELPLQSSVTTHLGATWPFSETALNDLDGVVFRIRLHKKTGRFESNTHTPVFPF